MHDGFIPIYFEVYIYETISPLHVFQSLCETVFPEQVSLNPHAASTFSEDPLFSLHVFRRFFVIVPMPTLVCLLKAGGVPPLRRRYDGEHEKAAPPRLGVGSEHTQEPGNVS